MVPKIIIIAIWAACCAVGTLNDWVGHILNLFQFLFIVILVSVWVILQPFQALVNGRLKLRRQEHKVDPSANHVHATSGVCQQ